MRPRLDWAAGDPTLALIPAGTQFESADLIFFAGNRTLAEAIAEADLLVSCPHSGSALPQEIEPHIVPTHTRRLQFDFTDMTTAPIVRRWAEMDPKIIYVENPHPRIVRDANRATPADLGADLAEAFRRVRAAGPYNKVDLTGVDAIRPVTFSFYPLLREPTTAGTWAELVADFTLAGTLGVDVYQRTRIELLQAMTAAALARGKGARFTALSFHDTMNTTTKPNGAITVPRPTADLLPPLVALSNRGNATGGAHTGHHVTMDPERLRLLAQAHRDAFDVAPTAVKLNQPYLGSQEIIESRQLLAGHNELASAAGVALDAVQAEFRRETLLGSAAVEVLHRPGADWPTLDEGHIDELAHNCRAAWDRYRSS